MIKKESSVQFELQGLSQEQPQPKITPQTTDDNHYRQAEITQDESTQVVIKLQKTLKSQYLILNNQQKRKADNIKLIECAARKAVEKWIYTQCLIEDGPVDNRLLLNQKDLQDIQSNLHIDLARMIGQLLNKNELLKLFTMVPKEPPLAMVEDLSNFNPQYLSILTTLLLQQISLSPKLQSICEVKTSLVNKFLDNIYRRYECQLFSQRLLQRGLLKMCQIKSQLNIDFSRQYERIKEIIAETQFAKLFVYSTVGEESMREVVDEIERVVFGGGFEGESTVEDIVQEIRITEMDDSNKKVLIDEFKKELEAEEDYVNFKIGMLTLKSIRESRRIIEEVSVIFVEDFLDSIDAFPQQIRHLVGVYTSAASTKFPQFKPDDAKTFLVKTVFSKWIFTDLMRYYCSRSNLSVQVKNVNFSTVCLILQKILYGQQFYERQTYAYFNKLIAHYSERVGEFMNSFGRKSEVKRDFANRVDVLVWSLETVRFVVKTLKDNIAIFGDYQPYHYLEPILSKQHYQMGNLKYPPSKLYVLYIQVRTGTLSKLFNPKQKLRKILIQFLLSIPQLTEPVSLPTLLDRHKYGSQTGLNSKVSVQLYANYLNSLRGSLDLEPTVSSIYLQLKDVKKQQKINRVLLQTTKSYYDALEKAFMGLTEERVSVRMSKVVDEVFREVPMRWRMIVRPGEQVQVEKTKETQFGKNAGDGEGRVSIYESDTVKEFLINIAMIYQPTKSPSDKEMTLSINKVYNSFLEDLIEAATKHLLSKNQKIDSTFFKKIRDKVGVMLYNQIHLKNIRTDEDKQLCAQIDRLQFIGMRHLQQKFTLEQPLFAELITPLRSSLSQPNSPESLIKHFYNLIVSFQQVILSTGKAADVTAQVQLPLMQFLILKSKVPNLASIMRFIDTFHMEETMSTVLGQTMTVILSSVVLIKDMNGERLGISEEEFQRLVGGHTQTTGP